MEKETKNIKEGELVLDSMVKAKLFFDALGTTVALYNPETALSSKEELQLFNISESQYSEDGITRLFGYAKNLGLLDDLCAMLETPEIKNMMPIKKFYLLCDTLAKKYCEKIGDVKEEFRINVLKKVYHFADPEIFAKANQYAQKEYGESIDMFILTNANPIMKEVYNQMLQGFKVKVMTVPDKTFQNLNKDNPELYNLIAKHLKVFTPRIGLIDDAKKNIDAGRLSRIKVQLFDTNGFSLDSEPAKKWLKSQTNQLIDKIFNPNAFEKGNY